MPTPIGQRFFEAYPWRLIVTNLQTHTLTWIERLASNISYTRSLNQASVISGTVPSDSPEVYIPADDGDPFLHEGTRLIYGFRREGADSSEGPWICRASGVVLELTDSGPDGSGPTSRFTAYDPWKYLYRIGITNPETGTTEIPDEGYTYLDSRGSDIILEQISFASLAGEPFIDYGSSGFWDGTVEDTEVIEEITFQRGCSVGELLDMLVATGTLDVEFNPIYDPTNRAGYLSELNVWIRQGSHRYNSPFGWDEFPKNVVQIDRVRDGTIRANSIQYYAGQGGPAVPLKEDLTSIDKYGLYFEQRFWPGQESVGVIAAMAEIALANIANGQVTFTLNPAAERAPIPLVEYAIGDEVPLYASHRLREPVDEFSLRVISIPIVIGDDQLERVQTLLVSTEVDST